MFRNTLTVAILLAAGANAQAALIAGDLAFTSFNADEDGWSLVSFVDIAPNTNIFFTDNTWNGASFANTESAHSWNSGSSSIAAGSVIRFSKIDSTALSSSAGSLALVNSSNLGMNASNETIYTYLSSTNNWQAPTTFLSAITSATSGFANASTGVLTGTGLTSGSSAVAITPSTDFGEYTGLRVGQNSFLGYKPLVNNGLIWATNTGGDQSLAVPDTTTFSVNAVPVPGAVWLFGSALLGLIGKVRRKA